MPRKIGLTRKHKKLRTSYKLSHQRCAHHIIECIMKVETIVKVDPELNNAILFDAAIRNLQTLSEATQYIKNEIRDQHAYIPWGAMRNARNHLAHGFFSSETTLAMKILITDTLPKLRKILLPLYPNWRQDAAPVSMNFIKFQKLSTAP